jgi:hypothetical protein
MCRSETLRWTLVDEVGHRYGRLIVVGFSHVDKWKRAMWECACECGRSCIVKGTNLRRGLTRSCGCLHAAASVRNLYVARAKKKKVTL